MATSTRSMANSTVFESIKMGMNSTRAGSELVTAGLNSLRTDSNYWICPDLNSIHADLNSIHADWNSTCLFLSDTRGASRTASQRIRFGYVLNLFSGAFIVTKCKAYLFIYFYFIFIFYRNNRIILLQ